MQRHLHELTQGIWLDARRAVWFVEEKALAVADLHLGFAWANRAGGSLFPLHAADDTVERLDALVQDYKPKAIVVLGDIVHRAVPLAPIKTELCRWHETLSKQTELQLVIGNHDRGLGKVFEECGIGTALITSAQVGPHLLLHGDGAATAPPAAPGRTFMGHEHPAIKVGDGVANMKCPCFLVGPQVVVLPAFSTWAAGSNVRQRMFLSPLARQAKFEQAFAILGHKLLPLQIRVYYLI